VSSLSVKKRFFSHFILPVRGSAHRTMPAVTTTQLSSVVTWRERERDNTQEEGGRVNLGLS